MNFDQVNLVFASGFLFPQRILGQDYFRGFRAAFPAACFPDVPIVGPIEARATALAETITAFRFPAPAAPIHVLAHSMGGLDARFALHENLRGMADRVASLSTVATPHAGSPIADFLVDPAPAGLSLRSVVRGALSALGMSAGALGNLTTGFAERFNRDHPDIRGIPCHCYAGDGTGSAVLNRLRLYLRRVGTTEQERANDGLVTVASASWLPLAEAPWPTDHLGEVGHTLSPPAFASAFAHVDAWRRAIQKAVGHA